MPFDHELDVRPDRVPHRRDDLERETAVLAASSSARPTPKGSNFSAL